MERTRYEQKRKLVGNYMTLRKKKLQQTSQIKVREKKTSPNKCAKLPSLLTWSTKHKVMNQNKAPKGPRYFQNLYVLDFLSCALRLPAFTSWLKTITGKYLHKQVSSCPWGFQFSSADFVHMNDPTDLLRGDTDTLHFTASTLAKSALFQHHSSTIIPMPTWSHGAAELG